MNECLEDEVTIATAVVVSSTAERAPIRYPFELAREICVQLTIACAVFVPSITPLFVRMPDAFFLPRLRAQRLRSLQCAFSVGVVSSDGSIEYHWHAGDVLFQGVVFVDAMVEGVLAPSVTANNGVGPRNLAFVLHELAQATPTLSDVAVSGSRNKVNVCLQAECQRAEAPPPSPPPAMPVVVTPEIAATPLDRPADIADQEAPPALPLSQDDLQSDLLEDWYDNGSVAGQEDDGAFPLLGGFHEEKDTPGAGPSDPGAVCPPVEEMRADRGHATLNLLDDPDAYDMYDSDDDDEDAVALAFAHVKLADKKEADAALNDGEYADLFRPQYDGPAGSIMVPALSLGVDALAALPSTRPPSKFVTEKKLPTTRKPTAFLGYSAQRRLATHPRDPNLKIERVADAIVAAIKPRSHVFVDAGTGSGKTRAIVGLIDEAIPGARIIFVTATVALVCEAGETLSTLCAKKAVVCRYHESQNETAIGLASVLVCTPEYLLTRAMLGTGQVLASSATDAYVLDEAHLDKVTLTATRQMILAIRGNRALVEMTATPSAENRIASRDATWVVCAPTEKDVEIMRVNPLGGTPVSGPEIPWRLVGRYVAEQVLPTADSGVMVFIPHEKGRKEFRFGYLRTASEARLHVLAGKRARDAQESTEPLSRQVHLVSAAGEIGLNISEISDAVLVNCSRDLVESWSGGPSTLVNRAATVSEKVQRQGRAGRSRRARVHMLNYDESDVGATSAAGVDDFVSLGRAARAIQGNSFRDLADAQAHNAAREWMLAGERCLFMSCSLEEEAEEKGQLPPRELVAITRPNTRDEFWAQFCARGDRRNLPQHVFARDSFTRCGGQLSHFASEREDRVDKRGCCDFERAAAGIWSSRSVTDKTVTNSKVYADAKESLVLEKSWDKDVPVSAMLAVGLALGVLVEAELRMTAAGKHIVVIPCMEDVEVSVDSHFTLRALVACGCRQLIIRCTQAHGVLVATSIGPGFKHTQEPRELVLHHADYFLRAELNPEVREHYWGGRLDRWSSCTDRTAHGHYAQVLREIESAM